MTTPSSKIEYPPLLAIGLHLMTIKQVRDICVDAFPTSKTREKIMDGLELVIHALIKEKVEGNIWVDGSFLTEKIDPKDSDILLYIQGDFYDNATPEQRKVIDWVSDEDLKTPHLCDSYVHHAYPEGHAWYWRSVYMFAYWMKQYGFSREEAGAPKYIKGIAVIKLN